MGILEQIRLYLKCGYNYIKFDNIQNENIEINKIDYKYVIENKKK